MGCSWRSSVASFAQNSGILSKKIHYEKSSNLDLIVGRDGRVACGGGGVISDAIRG